MIGILIMSHGNMAEGMLHTSTLFFGPDQPQIEAVCLQADNSPDEFDERMKAALERVDDGHGTIILCDLFMGTPCNRSMYVINDRVQCIPGMNMSILLELLGRRMGVEDISEIDINELVNIGRDGLVSLNEKVKEMMG